ncbi:MAG: NTP transferase domain-containing protein [Calditrichaeota bacterium]|nr:NTP transferase domain-containing protein [Calditrichota bacterium]
MQAVILAGGLETNLSILTRHYPKALLNIANQPLIDYVLSYLRQWEVKDVIFCVNHETSVLKNYLDQPSFHDFTFRFYEEEYPRGTAGTLVDIRKWLTDDHVLVLNGNVISQLDVSTLVHYHDLKKSYFTIVTGYPVQEPKPATEITIAADGSVKTVKTQPYAFKSEFSTSPRGIYLLNPKILDIFSRYKGYLDLKEQFIAALKNKNVPIYSYISSEFIQSIESLEDYLQTNFDVLYQNWMTRFWGNEIREQVWVGRGVQIDPDTEIIGPVVIGEYTTIEQGVRIVGPAVIGQNCHFAEGSFLRESVVWDNSVFRRNSHVEYSLIGESFSIRERSFFSRQVMLDMPMEIGQLNLLPRNLKFDSLWMPEPRSIVDYLKLTLFEKMKRGIDFLGAVFLSLLFSPVLILAALAVLVESGRPVFEKEHLIGRWGRPFGMWRFRIHARRAKRPSINQKPGDSVEEPRLTRVGKFLALMGINELPQVFNVLKGDMSLVGPRPLARPEMRFSPGWRDVRLRVKPGLTGLWQVSRKDHFSFHEWIRNDIYYVRNQSLLLDFKILLRTPFRVLRG